MTLLFAFPLRGRWVAGAGDGDPDEVAIQNRYCGEEHECSKDYLKSHRSS